MIGPQSSAVAGFIHSAAAFQQTHVPPADSVVVESPLPGGIAALIRFLLNNVPPWVQMGGIVLAAVVGVLLLRLLYVRRAATRGWLSTRSRGVRIALGAAAAVMLLAAGGMGAATWNYTQHSNDFCTGCHVMNPAFQRFSSAENKHAGLSCHDCHQQSMYASARQFYLWIAERPAEIGEHAEVPNRVCAACHVTGDTASWQRIASTAGHRVHLESDSTALEDLQCVTCHGVEVHRFKPARETCGQSGCHATSETAIVLGKMADQTMRHCAGCHPFTAPVPALATRDSARGTLVPGKPECLGCHEMQALLADFDEGRDPHGGKCGTCHNPHTDSTPAVAARSCATSGCHANWRDEPFHTGASHQRVGSQCLTCHVPHRSKVDASACEGCHESVRARSTLRPPVRFDTTRALRRVDTTGGPSPPEDVEEGMEADVPFFEHASIPPPVQADSFPHARHAKLACLVCHETGSGRGRLTFEAPRGCTICHHQAPRADGCAACHRPDVFATPKPATVTVAVRGRQPVPRPVNFEHDRHTRYTCVECHTTPVSLAPTAATSQCADCHAEHHERGRTCSACHTLANPGAEHRTLEVAHQRCDACHTASTIARLTPTRSFCNTCHAPQTRGHYDDRECSVCHFLAEPNAYRPRLISPPDQ